jgi:hypothetical protein
LATSGHLFKPASARLPDACIHPCPVSGAALVRTELLCAGLERDTRKWVDVRLQGIGDPVVMGLSCCTWYVEPRTGGLRC